MPQTQDDIDDFMERGRAMVGRAHAAQRAADAFDAQLTAVRRVLAHLRYQHNPREMTLDAGRSPGGVWLEVVCYRQDALTGDWGTGRGGKRYLPATFSASDVVRTAFSAIAAYEEHELRENFLYRERAVFGPHLDLDQLAATLGAETGLHTTQEDTDA